MLILSITVFIWTFLGWGTKDFNCDECDNPESLLTEDNKIVLEIYKYQPIKTLGNAIIIIDILVAKFLMELFKVEEYERKGILDKLIYYNSLINGE